MIGVVELLGGALLIAGLLVRPTALVLAGDMLGAILVSGIGKGEIVSLTLAPAELGAMLTLLWNGRRYTERGTRVRGHRRGTI